MGLRRISRQRAFQLLYALAYDERSLAEVEASFREENSKWRRGWKKFGKTLAEKTHENQTDLDSEIDPLLENWSPERISSMDRLCLRMGLCELKHFPEIPSRVTIDEYVELARTFGDDQSPAFVNGLLDKLASTYPEKDFGGKEPEADLEDVSAPPLAEGTPLP